jgi:hypothetical protein
MGFPILVLEFGAVIADGNIVLFARSSEVDRIGVSLDGLIVVVKLCVLDGIEAAVGISVDADANASMSLENESSTQSDDLRDLHDESWIGWLIGIVFEVV